MLYVIATPIGNLNDITLRALEALRSVDVIAAEDTRHSGNLLRHFEIRKPLISYHEHNEAMRAEQLAERLAAGESVALITDAGMPGLSDPGARLIRKCIERELPYTIVPGVSAILAALVGSGISMDRFCFRGFLPVKSGQRERELRAAAEREETSVFFESPYRILKTLAACAEIMPERQLCVARELTKKFEEFRRGTAADLTAHYDAHPAKGEITLVISGAERCCVSSRAAQTARDLTTKRHTIAKGKRSTTRLRALFLPSRKSICDCGSLAVCAARDDTQLPSEPQ
jgi:16S rRNA (cytidine1402-2'-O)-methyltransferase